MRKKNKHERNLIPRMTIFFMICFQYNMYKVTKKVVEKSDILKFKYFTMINKSLII